MAFSIQELVEAGTLTPRQGQVATLLSEGHKARDIAEQLNITRNAVYAQINAIKKKGVLDGSYTPSGEVRTPAPRVPSNAAEILEHIVPGAAPRGTEAYMDIIRELMSQNRILLELVERLSKTS